MSNNPPIGYCLIFSIILTLSPAFGQAQEPSAAGTGPFSDFVNKALNNARNYDSAVFEKPSSGAEPYSQALAYHQVLTDKPLDRAELYRFLHGATLGVFLHEIGHMFVDIYDLPVIGSQEDLADEFATMWLIDQAQRSLEGHGLAKGIFETYAALWHTSLQAVGDDAKTQDIFTPYFLWDEHTMSQKRAYNMLCLMYGAFPSIYNDLLDAHGARPERKDACQKSYLRKRDGWNRLLGCFRRENAEACGNKLAQEGQIRVVYRPSETAKPLPFYQNRHLREFFLLTAAALISREYLMPYPITVQSRDCGIPDAHWNPDDLSIVLCREFFTLLADSYVQHRTGMSYSDWEASLPSEPIPGKYFGHWRYEDFTVRDLILKPDGTFITKIHCADRQECPLENGFGGIYGMSGNELWFIKTVPYYSYTNSISGERRLAPDSLVALPEWNQADLTLLVQGLIPSQRVAGAGRYIEQEPDENLPNITRGPFLYLSIGFSSAVRYARVERYYPENCLGCRLGLPAPPKNNLSEALERMTRIGKKAMKGEGD